VEAEQHRQPWRLDARGQRVFDVLLATGLLLPVLVFPLYGDDGLLSAELALAQLVPLYWRRKHAVRVVLAVVALASAAQALLIDLPL
jgi:hypothetical protein